jgi:hypothetical protein
MRQMTGKPMREIATDGSRGTIPAAYYPDARVSSGNVTAWTLYELNPAVRLQGALRRQWLPADSVGTRPSPRIDRAGSEVYVDAAAAAALEGWIR